MRAPKSVWGQLIALLYSLLSKKKSKEAPHTTSCAEARGAESHTTAAMADNNRNRRFILWFGFSIRIGPAYKDTFLIPENKAYRTHFIGRDSADETHGRPTCKTPGGSPPPLNGRRNARPALTTPPRPAVPRGEATGTGDTPLRSARPPRPFRKVFPERPPSSARTPFLEKRKRRASCPARRPPRSGSVHGTGITANGRTR